MAISDPQMTGENPTTEEALCEVLVRRSGPMIAYLEKRIPQVYKGAIVAEDVFQDVCERAIDALSTFRNDSADALDRWLTTIADRRILNRIRDEGRKKRGGGKPAFRAGDKWKTSCINLLDHVRSPAKTPCGEAQRAEAVGKVLVSLARLRPEFREVIKLRHMEDLSVEQIAAKMGRSEGSVSSLLYRGMIELRRLMGDKSNFLSDDGSVCSNSPNRHQPD